MKSESPLKDMGDVFSGAAQGASAGEANEELEAQQQEMQDAFNEKLEAFANKEFENPFANMTNQFAGLQNEMENISTENKFEDLTVNLKSADYQKQMAQESEAQVIKAAQAGAGGAGGVAAIASMLARQNARVRQGIAADIGAQEAQNQRLMAQGAEQARQVQQNIARESNRIDQVIAQGAADIQTAKAEGEMDIQRMESEREAIMLGYEADMLAGSLSSTQAQIDANTAMVGDTLGSLGDMASTFA